MVLGGVPGREPENLADVPVGVVVVEDRVVQRLPPRAAPSARGGQSLYHAVFDYNHADWYVREVLGLAARYAAEYH